MGERVFKKNFLRHMNWVERGKLIEVTEGSKIDYFFNEFKEEDGDVWEKMCEYFDIEKHPLDKFIENSNLQGIKLLYKKHPNEVILEVKKQKMDHILFELEPKFILEDNIYNELDDVIEIDKKILRDLYERAK